jgi:hypothetical protein
MLSGAGVGYVDRGHQDPRNDLRALREMVVALSLCRRQPIAIVRDSRRIGSVELDLHAVFEQPADHRDGVEDGREQVEASQGRQRVNQKAESLITLSSYDPGLKNTSKAAKTPFGSTCP